MRRLLLLALVACSKTPTPAPRAEPVDAAPAAPAPPASAAPAPAAPAPATATATHLSLIKQPGKDGGQVCLVVDDAGKTVGHATSKDTAAGGSDVACDRFENDGSVIVFTNSRGTYAKDARPGPHNDQPLPCGEGVFASDLSSCVELDGSPFLYTPGDPKAEPYTVAMHDTDLGKEIPLVTIPHALGRSPSEPRPWGGAYCSNSRFVLVAMGELSLYDAPSGKRLARASAKGATRVECTNGEVTINKPSRRFRVDDKALTSVGDQ